MDARVAAPSSTDSVLCLISTLGWVVVCKSRPSTSTCRAATSLVHAGAPHVLLLHPGVLGVEPHGLQHSLHHVLAAVRLPARVAAVRQLLQHPARPPLDSCSAQRQAAGMGSRREAQHNNASKHADTRGLRGTPSPEGAGRGSVAKRWINLDGKHGGHIGWGVAGTRGLGTRRTWVRGVCLHCP